ncbi:oxygenase MpaB family protein [Nevskia ramosa]|uniref:oxygenase MpaB family protein n=1 Tax=Nevskia ramosa TaxID=64002 RepID=UPI0003B47550|nr:oxygenase MpaB family protein [Nevskia ramosa]
MGDRKQKAPPPSAVHPAGDRPRRNDKVVPISTSKLAATTTPLSPDSLTWQLFGDLRGLLLIVRTGTLQNMHPDISAALVEHSNFFQNPWHRLLRSMPPILGVVYDGDRALCTGRQVRDFHRGIGGHSNSGHAYHALNPELYYWAHATFFEGQIALCEFFGTPLSETDKERLYRESIQWYALYGLTMAPVPPDYASFQRYWQQMIDTRLQNTTVTDWYFRNGHTVPAPYGWLRGPLWNRLLRPIVSGGSQWLAAGTLPPVLRERLGLAWTKRDERLLRGLGSVTRGLWRLTPQRWRYLPTARQAMQRAATGVRACPQTHGPSRPESDTSAPCR